MSSPRSSSSLSEEGVAPSENGEALARRRRYVVADKLAELQGLNGQLASVNDKLNVELKRREMSLCQMRDGSGEVDAIRVELKRQAETIATLQHEITKLNGKHKQACKVLVDRMALEEGTAPEPRLPPELLSYADEPGETHHMAASMCAMRPGGPLSCAVGDGFGRGCVLWNTALSVFRIWDHMWRASTLVPKQYEQELGQQSPLTRVVAWLLDDSDDSAEEVEGEVNLSHCNLGDTEMMDLCTAVAGSKRPVEKMLLGGNRVGWRGAARIAELLQSKHCVVTTLDMRWNWLGESGTARLASALELNNTLIDLDLWKNDVGPGAAASVRDALRHNQTLERLSLWGNRLRDIGIVQISKGLAENSALLRLDVADNSLGPEGFEAIARALQSSKCGLTHLSCGRNPQSGDRGALALAAALAAPTCKLRSLDADGNSMTDAGAAAIAASLQENSTLTEINLASNYIAVPGATAIAQCVQSSGLLRLRLDSNRECGGAVLPLCHAPILELTLTHVDIAQDCALKLATLLEDPYAPTKLRHLDLSDAGLDFATKTTLRDAANKRANDRPFSVKL